MRKIVSGALIAAAASGGALAATWNPAGQGSNGTVAEFDAESVSINGDIVAAWIRYDFSQVPSEPAHSGMSRIETDCGNSTQRTLSMIRYSKTGDVIQDASTPYSRFELIIPESLGEYVAKALCGYKDVRARLFRE